MYQLQAARICCNVLVRMLLLEVAAVADMHGPPIKGWFQSSHNGALQASQKILICISVPL